MLGRVLDDSRKNFSASEIIEAFEQGKTDELLAQTQKTQQIADLYSQWCDLYDAQRATAQRGGR